MSTAWQVSYLQFPFLRKHECLRYSKGLESLWNKMHKYIFSLTDLRGKVVFRYCILET